MAHASAPFGLPLGESALADPRPGPMVGGFLVYVQVDGIPRYPVEKVTFRAEPTPERIERGRKLASALCANCHGDPTTKQLTGKQMVDAPAEFGIIYSANMAEIPRPQLGEGQVRVRIEAAGVNPSDVLSAEGRFPHAVLPRVLGRDFAGRVVEGPAELVGAAVWGSGGDLGITRDGAHAEELLLPASGVARRPANLTPEQAASAGVPFTTAWSCLVDAAALRSGETAIVSGAVGAVGWAAVELAAALGSRVVALVLDAAEAARVDRPRVAGVARFDANDLPAVVREVTGGRGAEVALNGVGAPVFRPLLDALALGGRLCVYSAAAGREVPLDLFDFYRRRLRLLGINTAVLTVADGARILDQLRPLFESGKLRPHPLIEPYPLEEAATAYAKVASGSASKVVLVPRAATGS